MIGLTKTSVFWWSIFLVAYGDVASLFVNMDDVTGETLNDLNRNQTINNLSPEIYIHITELDDGRKVQISSDPIEQEFDLTSDEKEKFSYPILNPDQNGLFVNQSLEILNIKFNKMRMRMKNLVLRFKEYQKNMSLLIEEKLEKMS